MFEWIDNIVLGLIENYETTDVYELCDSLSIKIVKLDYNNILLRKKDAYYYRDLDDKEVIFIRDNLHPLLEQFILKHELGHALCHPNSLCVGHSFSNKGKLERQADYFALKLSNIKFDEIELNEMTLEQISNCIGIPENALIQMVNL